MKTRPLGFTLLEAMAVVAVLAILVALAMPSFNEMIAKRRLKGAASVLNGDLQYARSEAVQRNVPVTVTFTPGGAESWCYIIHTQPATVSTTTCTCGTSGSCTAPEVNLKNVSGGDYSGVSLEPTGLAPITFEPRQGTAAAVNVTFTGINSLQLVNQVNPLGRIHLCGTVTGYPSCPP